MVSPPSPPENEDIDLMRDANLQLNLQDLRGQLTVRLTIMLLAVAQLLVLAYDSPVTFPLNMVLFWLSLTLLGIAIISLRETHPTLIRHLFVWGTAVNLVVAMFLFPYSWLPYIGIVLVFSNAMLVHSSEFPMAVIVSITAIYLDQKGIRAYDLGVLIALLIISVTIAALSVRNLYTTLDWLWHMHRHSRDLLNTTRNQQAELHSMIKSLHIANDIRERNKYELIVAYKEAESAKRLKEQFAANISHELRTPLSIILGFSEVMYLSPEVYGETDMPPTLLRDIAQIYRNSHHLLGMIDDILDLSRFEIVGFTLKKEPTHLPTLLNEAASIVQNLFEQSGNMRLDVDIAPDLPEVEVDQTRIRQVLLNLLNNAHRFTQQGIVTLSAKQGDGVVIIEVRDTGPGIPPHKTDATFTEFYQMDHSLSRSHGGTGLGLTICQRLVKAHDGRIWVESEEGVGTTFSFTLPVKEPLALQLHSYRTVSRETGDGAMRPTLLFVESDPYVARMVMRHLTAYEVVAVADPADLAQQVKRYRPFAILYNLRPEQERDVSLTTAVSIPIIECSLPSHSWMASTLGAVAAMTKPIDFEQLRAKIDQVGGVVNILVIDDNPGVCQLIERSLGAENSRYTIRIAYDGNAGLRAMEQQRPDFVILDLIMPEMDGFELIQQMKADLALATVPILLLTATTYIEETLAQYGNQLKIVQADPWHPAKTLHFLEAALSILNPQNTP